MSDYIPFLNSKIDCQLLSHGLGTPSIVRVQLSRVDILKSTTIKSGLWIDSCFDSFHDWDNRGPNVLSEFTALNTIIKSDFKGLFTATSANLKKLVPKLLDLCLRHEPEWISVPQLPHCRDRKVWSENKTLAKETAAWKSGSKWHGKLILPVIITHQDLTNVKGGRNKIVLDTKRALQESGAQGIWVVDSSLNDQKGSSKLRQKRFGSIVKLHAELRQAIDPSIFVIAGPYWGLNIVLWARNLVDRPAIGIGPKHQYYLPGGVYVGAPITRIALPPLRRLVQNQGDIQTWLNAAKNDLGKNSSEYLVFDKMLQEFNDLRIDDVAKKQIFKFYTEWIESIQKIPVQGRALALYQDLSTAYVIGRTISSALPRSEQSAMKPESIAEALMLNCL